MTTIEDLEIRLAELEARAGVGVGALAANPPITIGELTDVPAPGSAIASTWAQEVTRRSAHRFATAAARDAAYPAASAGAGAVCVTLDTATEWISTGTTWLPLGVGLAKLSLAASYTGAATNNAQIPWTASSNIGGFGVGTTVTVPGTGLYAITTNIAYSGASVTASAFYTITVGAGASTPFPIAHGNVGGTAATIVIPMATNNTIIVTVSPGLTMPGSTCQLWVNRIGA